MSTQKVYFQIYMYMDTHSSQAMQQTKSILGFHCSFMAGMLVMQWVHVSRLKQKNI